VVQGYIESLEEQQEIKVKKNIYTNGGKIFTTI
jgi:hypothetical protein